MAYTVEYTKEAITGFCESVADFEAMTAPGVPCKFAANERHVQCTFNGKNTDDALEWYGLEGNTKAAVKKCGALLRDGWQDGVKRMRQHLTVLGATISAKAPDVRRRPIWSDDGGELDMDKVRSGNLDTAYRRCARRQQMRPAMVAIGIHTADNCNVTSEAMFWRGAAALCLADHLITRGYPVELSGIIAANMGEQRSRRMNLRYIVKAARGPYSLPHACAALALPGTFRTAGFYWYEKYSDIECGAGLGQTASTADALAFFTKSAGNGAVVSLATGAIKNQKTAQAWIEVQIARLSQPQIKAA